MKITNKRSSVSHPKRPAKSGPRLNTKRISFFKNCIILLFLISSISVNAQNFQVSGKVTGEDGKGLAGVTVSQKGNQSKTNN